MAQHSVASYDNELRELSGLVANMGGLVDRLLGDALKTMQERDVSLADHVINADRAVDVLQHQIEEKAVSIIARRQPVASDLREIISTVKVASDLERVGDLSKNIAKRVIATSMHTQPASIAHGLEHMGERVREQVVLVLSAYQKRDDEQALEVWRSDSEIDTMNTALFRELLTYMMEDPRNIGFCTHLLFCAKNLERIGDHATNIAETVHYLVTGEIMSADRPKGDQSGSLPPNGSGAAGNS